MLKKATLVFDQEIQSLKRTASLLNVSFEAAVSLILSSQGRVVVVGMGKSGIIGQKIVATLASTGQPSLFVHPGDAFHGDLGMIKSTDIALLISNSGETEELIRLLPFLKYQKNRIIALTGNLNSTLAKNADIVLDVGVEKEACNINLAPTSSTTCTLVMGDALAIVLSTVRDFQPRDFARFHPGGSLGRKLLTRVCDVMHTKNLPICDPSSSFINVIQSISKGRLGLVIVIDKNKLMGVITDGDIRRAIENHTDFANLLASNFMSKSPKTIDVDMFLSEAEKLMLDNKVNSLIALQNGAVKGVLQIYD